MSNSLKKITIPKLTQSGLGKSIVEQFANIDFNFQKLAALDVNSGAPGASCMYITYNLAAPFVYCTSDSNDNNGGWDRKAFQIWKMALQDKHTAVLDKLIKSVEKDYEEYKAITGGTERSYAAMAAYLLWGSQRTFVKDAVPTDWSLTGTLHNKYQSFEAGTDLEIDDITKTIYGNWLYEFFTNTGDGKYETLLKLTDLLADHTDITTPGKIVVAVSPLKDDPTSYRPVGSLAYWYLDPRFQTSSTHNSNNIQDMSCVMHWNPDEESGHFDILNIFPTLQMNDEGKWTWVINGYNTGISPEGTKGDTGAASNFVVVERVENVTGWNPKTAPAGERVVGPTAGTFNFYVDAFTGRSSRYANALNQPTSQFPINFSEKGLNVEAVDDEKLSGNVKKYKVTISNNDSWLPSDAAIGQNLTTPENLYRIYRVLGQDIEKRFFTTTKTSDSDAVNQDLYDHQGDPSCESYYGNGSKVNSDADVQKLIKSLDGCPAIVLPGPAFMQDRTDTTYWFATLKAVPSKSGGLMLVAYCSSDSQINTNIDEHTYAGMMQSLDTYTYKAIGDARNKPRGLMLPIGSANATNYTDAAEAFASHLIYSDLGGFLEMGDISNNKRTAKTQQSITANTLNSLGYPNIPGDAQFREVFGKKVLHIGSVTDYRGLNFVPNGQSNAAVPGREPWSTGGVSDSSAFAGSELHIDEPVTITSYRDTMLAKRLLTVEGDAVIGPCKHVNGANDASNAYHYFGGGLYIGSNLADTTFLPDHTVFSTNTITSGIRPSFKPFAIANPNVTNTNPPIANLWRTSIARVNPLKGQDSAYTMRSIIKTGYSYPSILAEDMIGARVLMATDGITIYQENADYPNETAAFSVDYLGNIQTRGSEVRSNSRDTSWFFHTRWENSDSDNRESMLFMLNGTSKTLTLPSMNALMYGTDHEVRFVSPDQNALRQGQDIQWRNTNNITYINDAIKANKYSYDIDKVPAGWCVSQGFTNSLGKHKITFDTEELNSFGSNELLPTIIYQTADVLHHHGALTVDRPHINALNLNAEGQVLGRFGIQSSYGLVIGGPARGGALALDGDTNISADDITKITLTIPSIAKADTTTNAVGDNSFEGDKGFASSEHTSNIGLWVRDASAYIGVDMISGGNLEVRGVGSVRNQLRAKSFRRHSTVDYTPEYGILFDGGTSSRKAFKHIVNGVSDGVNPASGNKVTTLTSSNSVTSPIIYDLGPAYKSCRFIKFGMLGDAKINNDDAVLSEVLSEKYSDKKSLLYGINPVSSASVIAKNGYLFKTSGAESTGTKYHAFSVTATNTNMMATVSINVNMDKQFTSKDRDKKGMFGGGRYSKAYGFLWQGQNPAETSDAGDNPGSCECDGFVWSDIMGDFPKPSFPVTVFVNSLYRSTDGSSKEGNHNWNIKGTDSARDRQYGVWFELTPAGKLRMTAATAPGAMYDTAKNITLTFTYPVIPSEVQGIYYIACYTNTSAAPDKTINYLDADCKETTKADIFNDLSNLAASSEHKYIWIKVYTGSKPGSTDAFKDINWQLYDNVAVSSGLILVSTTGELSVKTESGTEYQYLTKATSGKADGVVQALGMINGKITLTTINSDLSSPITSTVDIQPVPGMVGIMQAYQEIVDRDEDSTYVTSSGVDKDLVDWKKELSTDELAWINYYITLRDNFNKYSTIGYIYSIQANADESKSPGLIETDSSVYISLVEEKLVAATDDNIYIASISQLSVVNSTTGENWKAPASWMCGFKEVNNVATKVQVISTDAYTPVWGDRNTKATKSSDPLYYTKDFTGTSTANNTADADKQIYSDSGALDDDFYIKNGVDYGKVLRNTINQLYNSGLTAGCIDSSNLGLYVYLYSIPVDKWNDSKERLNLANYKKLDISKGAVDISDVFGKKTLQVRPSWSTYEGNTNRPYIYYKKSTDTKWSRFKDYDYDADVCQGFSWASKSHINIKTLRLWMGYMTYEYMVKNNLSNDLTIAAKIWTDLGWLGEYQDCMFDNMLIGNVTGVCQTQRQAPVSSTTIGTGNYSNLTTDDICESNNKLATKWDWQLNIIYNGFHGGGRVNIRLGNKYWDIASINKFFGLSLEADNYQDCQFAVMYGFSAVVGYDDTNTPNDSIERAAIPYVDILETDISLSHVITGNKVESIIAKGYGNKLTVTTTTT
jgi:hypothetical protein